jgi:predicted methyltransferase
MVEPAHDPELAMRPIHAAALVLALAATAGCAYLGSADSDAIARQLAAPSRSADDRDRDLRDHPDAVLALAAFGRGDTIADIFGGGGYYSEIVSGIVGPQGRVLLINNAPYDGFAKKGLGPRLAGSRLPNVTYSVAPNDALGLGRNTLDGALIVMSYHDLYVADDKDGWPAIDAGQFIDQIVAALKPGGRLLIVDHAAREGSGKADAQTLHRIEETFAVNDFKAHGLQFVGSIDSLGNRDDDRSRNVFDPAIKGRTDRFVHLYRKP